MTLELCVMKITRKVRDLAMQNKYEKRMLRRNTKIPKIYVVWLECPYLLYGERGR